MFHSASLVKLLLLSFFLKCIAQVKCERKLPSIWGDVMSVEQVEEDSAADFEPTGHYWVLAEVQMADTGKVS